MDPTLFLKTIRKIEAGGAAGKAAQEALAAHWMNAWLSALGIVHDGWLLQDQRAIQMEHKGKRITVTNHANSESASKKSRATCIVQLDTLNNEQQRICTLRTL